MNATMIALANSRPFGRFVGRDVAVITYTGRRSGRTFSTPVSHRRNGDDLQIAANMPDAKSWWHFPRRMCTDVTAAQRN
jgi:hypothetical protein